jgi:pyrimidine-specific ribonucleoside hydrolase
MKLIIETDIGRDLDDFIALCYLIDAGVNIRLITISPGDPDQVDVTRFLLKECGLNIPVGVSSVDRNKRSIGGTHVDLLNKYQYPGTEKHDGLGSQLLFDILKTEENIEYFGCGPLDSIGRITGPYPKKATIQGGYVSYEYLEKHGITPQIKLDKFVGKEFVPTFNLCGNVEAAKHLLNMPIEKRFISKNVCHTIVYENTMHGMVCSIRPKSRAGELLREAMGMYLKNHPGGKKFHDPSAAICHLHPEIGTWVKGRLVYDKGKWGTVDLLPYNCEIIGKIASHSMVHYLCKGE